MNGVCHPVGPPSVFVMLGRYAVLVGAPLSGEAHAGVTVKLVSRFAVVCEFAIVPSRQTRLPIVAPGAMTCWNGAGLPDDVANVSDPITNVPDSVELAGVYETKVPQKRIEPGGNTVAS